MGDSDEEFDRRDKFRRDKFRRERSDYDRRDDRRGRDNWGDDRRGGGGGYMGNWEGRGRDDRRDMYKDNYNRQRRFSPDHNDGSPPGKRMRREWGGEHEMPSQPALMSFKAFLASQDDNISDSEAISKFQDYKLDFKKTQISEFFVAHKDEEWFHAKYHPDECGKRLEEAKKALRWRKDVFMKLIDMGYMENLSLDIEKYDDIVRVLDAAVLLMEGGTDFDLKVLDKPDPKPVERKPKVEEPPPQVKPDVTDCNTSEQGEIEEGALEEGEEDGENPAQVDGPAETADSKDGEVESDISDEESDHGGSTASKELPKKEEGSLEDKEMDTAEEEEPRPRALHRTCSIFLRNLAPTITKQEVEAMCRRYPGFMRVALQDPQPERRFMRRGWVTFDRSVNIKDICWNLNNIRLRDCEMGAIVNRELKSRVRPVHGVTAHKPVVKSDLRHAANIVQNFDKKWAIWEDEKDEKKDPEKEAKDESHSFGLVSNNPLLKNITEYLVEEGSFEEEELLGQTATDNVDPNEEQIVDRDPSLLKVLDKMLLYLRIVHSFDYYSAVEYPNEDEMPHRCGIMHSRGHLQHITQADINEWQTNFEQRLKPFIDMKYKLNEEEAKKLGLRDQETELEKFVQANTQMLAQDKWLCPLSGKKFKGPEFVRKHIFNKHAEKVEEAKAETEYFNNYLCDPKRPQLPEHPSNRPPPSRDYNNGPSRDSGTRGDYGGGYGGRDGPQGSGGDGRDYNRGDRGGYNHGGRGRGYGGRGGYNNYNRGYQGGRDQGSGGNQFYDRRGNDRGYDRFPRRDRGRPDPRSIIEYRDLDAPQDVDML